MENLNLLPDGALISQFKAGENAAFVVLLDRYKGPLYEYVSCVLKSKDVTEDVLQEIFLKVMTTIRKGNYRDDGKFQCWLTRIAHNCIVDYYRYGKDDNQISKDNFHYDFFNHQKYSVENMEQKIINWQINQNIKKMISFLPKNQREIIQLRYYKGLSFKEISVLKGVSINTALGRMHYAVNNMRKMIREHQNLISL